MRQGESSPSQKVEDSEVRHPATEAKHGCEPRRLPCCLQAEEAHAPAPAVPPDEPSEAPNNSLTCRKASSLREISGKKM